MSYSIVRASVRQTLHSAGNRNRCLETANYAFAQLPISGWSACAHSRSSALLHQRCFHVPGGSEFERNFEGKNSTGSSDSDSDSATATDLPLTLSESVEKGLSHRKDTNQTMFIKFAKHLETSTDPDAAAVADDWKYLIDSTASYSVSVQYLPRVDTVASVWAVSKCCLLQDVLDAGGVWSDISMKDRIDVNAARVGLKVQEGSDELPKNLFGRGSFGKFKKED
jgi:hypothetical protein